MNEKRDLTVSEAGRLGGLKGGRSTKAKYGKEFFEYIGHKGGQKVRTLIKKGKK